LVCYNLKNKIKNIQLVYTNKTEDTINQKAKNTTMNGLIKIVALGMILLFISGFILIAVVLMAYSPGKPKPFFNENGNIIKGNISEKSFLTINGVKQGMFIKSKDDTHPVLLLLHGGMPEYFLSKKYPTGLEDYFTVVWWEQRCSRISYHSGTSPTSITLEQMVADASEVTKYLCKRFHKEKIYLMGHSGGSFIGIQVAGKPPENSPAYIRVAQMSNQLQSERLAYSYMLAQYHKKEIKPCNQNWRRSP
jgi:predicted alpha/beta-fold hydrolase